MREGKCIAFANHKGGTGKTTSCINIAGQLVKEGKKVLVVDLDAQGNATSGLGIDKEDLEFCMFDVLSEGLSLREVIRATGIENLYLAPATLDLAGINTLLHKTNVLKDIVKEVQHLYDYVLIDTPPSYGFLFINAVSAADSVVISLGSGAFALDSIKNLTVLLRDIQEELGSNIDIKCMTLTIPEDVVHKKISEFLSKRFKYIKYPAADMEDRLKLYLSVNNLYSGKLYVIPHSRKIYEAQLRGMPLSHYDPNHEINETYKEIVNSLL